MTPLDLLIRFVCGLVIAFAIALTGIGGGVLVMPVLTVLLGLEPVTAVGTDSLYVLLTKTYAGVEHWRLKTIRVRVCGAVLLGAVPGSLTAAVLVNRHCAHLADAPVQLAAFQDNLKKFIVAVMFLAIGFTIYHVLTERKRSAEGASAEPPRGARALLYGAGFGVFVGALMGSTSIGGGVIMVPALMVLFHLPANRAVGTSILIGLVLTMVTSVVYGMGGRIDYVTALVMAAGSVVGVYYGSRLSVRIPNRVLKWTLIVVMCAATVAMLLKNNAH